VDPAGHRAAGPGHRPPGRRRGRQLAGDLDAAARTWLGRQERRLRDRLARVAAVVLVALVAALALRRGSARREARPPGPAWADRRVELVTDDEVEVDGRTWCTSWPSCSTTPPPSRRRRRPSW
jgi:hypothetical protein